MDAKPAPVSYRRWLLCLAGLIVPGAMVAVFVFFTGRGTPQSHPTPPRLDYQPRQELDIGGYQEVQARVGPWDPSSLEDCSKAWKDIGHRLISSIDESLKEPAITALQEASLLMKRACLFNYEGEPKRAYDTLQLLRDKAEADKEMAEKLLYTIIFCQGVTSLRLGENENCILCRGESSCIFPLAPAAVHIHPAGSRQSVKHFSEYLQQFPDDIGVRWLLNLAHMTLGEYPYKVPSSHLLDTARFGVSEFDIGKFRDIGHLVGINRLNCAGGGIMEDFDNDGLLDIIVTTIDPTQQMAFYRNKGDGTFEDCTEKAGLSKQLGGMYCVQGDFNNDGHMDVFIPRGAWFHYPVRPTLLRNNGNGTFTDVTKEAKLDTPLNAITASWADYDNDGFLDLFVCCEQQLNRLYRNKGDGTFEEVAGKAGVAGNPKHHGKGAAWIDYDNDGWPDLFINNLSHSSKLFHNDRDGTFSEVTATLGITGPESAGFSCWAWDFDNDGFLDIFASAYFFTLDEVVKGMQGHSQEFGTSKLFRNKKGKGFEDVTKEAGLDRVYATMGSNFGDFDNDGFLDMYLSTGSPDLSLLVPNRMFKNVAGKRFAEITASSRTGHLQKGHSVACGDWDRDGNTDLFLELGGAIPGDRYHNVLFQNPGQGNNWLTVKLIGKKTNRAAIGARIKVVTDGEAPLTVHRHVTSGSSFGANTLQQTIGLAKGKRVASLEIHWPTSGTTQLFRDISVNQAIEVTEFAGEYRKLDWKPLPLPK